MDVNKISWQEEYNIGVDYVDNAHRQLFDILSDILNTFSEKDKDRYKEICSGTIAYLKQYTVKHFEQEEAYMRSIDYAGYTAHKNIHDTLREVTLVALEKDLIENDFSEDSVLRLVGLLSGWLTGHIMIEDRAITGRVASRYTINNEDSEKILENEFTKFMKDMFHLDLSLYYPRYNGEMINNPYLFCFDMKDEEDNSYRVVIVTEKPVILYMTSHMMGIKLEKLKKDALLSFFELATQISKQAVNLLVPSAELTLVDKMRISTEEFENTFPDGYPDFSPIWRCNLGLIGFCVDI